MWNPIPEKRLPMAIFALLLGGLSHCGLFAQSDINIPLRNDYFSDEAWVKSFTYTYGVDTRTEPTINAEEKELFDQLVPLIRININAAISTLRASITPESSPALNFTLGNLYFESKNYSSALSSYRLAIKGFPNFMRAHHVLGKLFVRTNNLKSAVPRFVKTIELGGATGDLYGLLGHCYYQLEMVDPALAAYQQALLYSPNNKDWKIGKTLCLSYMQKWEELITMLNELINGQPDRSDFWILQANAYLGLKKDMEAAANLEVLRRMGKARPDSLFLLGDIYINRGLAKLAYSVYAQALKGKEKSDIRIPLRVASTLAAQGLWDEAKSYLGSIRQSYGRKIKGKTELELLTLESEIALATGDTEKAVRTLKIIIDRDPLNCKSLLLLADFQWKDEQIEEAIFNFEAARKIDDCQYRALLQQSQMHVSRTEYSEAVPLLHEALDIEPTDNVEDYFKAVERAAASQRIK